VAAASRPTLRSRSSASDTNVSGTVYVLRFELAYTHARHYLGWTEGEVTERIAAHLQGRGSPLIRAAVAAGVEVQLAATYQGRGTGSGG
jgi:hypothetical protein